MWTGPVSVAWFRYGAMLSKMLLLRKTGWRVHGISLVLFFWVFRLFVCLFLQLLWLYDYFKIKNWKIIYIIHCLKDKYFNVDVPEMCRGCFYFIFNNNAWLLSGNESHCDRNTSHFCSVQCQSYTIFLKIKIILKPGNQPKIVLYPLR